MQAPDLLIMSEGPLIQSKRVCARMSCLTIAYGIHREDGGEYSGTDQVSGALEISVGSRKAEVNNANGRYLLAKEPCFMAHR